MPLSASRAHRAGGAAGGRLDRDTAQDRDDARLMPPRASMLEGIGEIRRLRPPSALERLCEMARSS